MGTLASLATAFTVWKVASRRLGPVGGLVATVVVMGGLAYLVPRLAVKLPALGRIVGDSGRTGESAHEEREPVPAP